MSPPPPSSSSSSSSPNPNPNPSSSSAPNSTNASTSRAPSSPTTSTAAPGAPTPHAAANSRNRASAPYEPFLNHAPPPVDSWIEVETTGEEYRLIVRLPGFKRDGITLATKKRRILHLVADSWNDASASSSANANSASSPNNNNTTTGAHFERRISFGYDADLERVRAEFDGEILRVVVPRKRMPGLSPGGVGGAVGGMGPGGGGLSPGGAMGSGSGMPPLAPVGRSS
ncbi:hypothetical protein C8R45DRAFT_821625 [Mycena sanguinolenta]|nr:hypothetical protein C8R45DRAFT_821625 [Mycena sanguinolenta]